jgi:hypothetical protein
MSVLFIRNFSEYYPVRLKRVKTDLEERIKLRLEHIEKRIKLFDDVSLKQLSTHGRGFAAGQIHRLIAERYFLETLLEE